MINTCEQYYKMNINGEDVPVIHRYTQITSKWFDADGNEYTDESVLEQILQQVSNENRITPASLYKELGGKVSWTPAPTAELPDRKTIVLKNGDMLIGTDLNGSQVNLAMVNRWGVADYGSLSIPFNINSSVRPTVQLPGESGDEAHDIAFMEDVGDSEYSKRMIGEMVIPDVLFETSMTPYYLPELEQSFVDDMGEPEYVDGNPISDTNKYQIGRPYIVIGGFDDDFVFHYGLYSPLTGKVGYIISLLVSAYDDLAKKIEKISG